jgi:hypothetical protein
MSRIDIGSEFYVDVSSMDGQVWLEVGSGWLHYANDNHGHVEMTREEAYALIAELQKVLAEETHELVR